jgi:asparagine synthase (glutamine-hydrolysing)
MCGIIGLYKKSDVDFEQSSLISAMKSLNHRGPDGSDFHKIEIGNGLLYLSHLRLAIIDLTDGGKQPMESSDGRFTIIFNGEIYNYKELREELKNFGYSFKTESDTEVLLACWSSWGIGCLEKFVGMFAFVLYDRQCNKLFLVRDAFGIKPLFYSLKDGLFTFSSELKGVLGLCKGSIKINLQKSYDYLVHGQYDSDEQTFISEVYQLAPSSYCTYDLETFTLSPSITWWNPKTEKSSNLNFKDAADELRQRFLSNIKYHLRSDVPFGCTLSGGLDSSAIACGIRHVEPDIPIHTFSYIASDERISEKKWVDIVNNRINGISHLVDVDSMSLKNDLFDLIETQGEPFLTTSIYAQFAIFRKAKNAGITVTLDGQGADELLAGYRGYPGKRIRSLLEKGQIFDSIKFLNQWSKWPDRNFSLGVKSTISEFLGKKSFQRIKELSGEERVPDYLIEQLVREHGVVMDFPFIKATFHHAGRYLVSELALASTKNGLPALLRHADRNSMRFSIEARVPFLTVDLANFLFSLPEEYLISLTGETKSIFRAAMRGIVPDQILDRKDKIGFYTPELEWMADLYKMKDLNLDNIPRISWLDHNKAMNKIERILSGKEKFDWFVWRYFNFLIWYKQINERYSVENS